MGDLIVAAIEGIQSGEESDSGYIADFSPRAIEIIPFLGRRFRRCERAAR